MSFSVGFFLRTSRASPRPPIPLSSLAQSFHYGSLRSYSVLRQLNLPPLPEQIPRKMPPKRKRSSVPAAEITPNGVHATPILPNSTPKAPPLKKRTSASRKRLTRIPTTMQILWMVNMHFEQVLMPMRRREAFDAASLAESRISTSTSCFNNDQWSSQARDRR